MDDNSQLRHSFGERVKELPALHQTARILQDDSRPFESLTAIVVSSVYAFSFTYEVL